MAYLWMTSVTITHCDSDSSSIAMLQAFLNSLLAGCIYSLVALGFGLIYTSSGVLHFAHGAVYVLAAYSAYYLLVTLHLQPFVGIVCGLAAGTALGVVIELLIYRRLRASHSSPAMMLLASLSILVLFQNGVALLFGNEPHVLRLESVKEGIRLMPGVHVTRLQLYIICVSVAATWATFAFLFKTRIGTLVRAISDDRELASARGLNVKRLTLLVFAIGSFWGSAAGIMVGMESDLTPGMGLSALLFGIAASIVGGMGSIAGALLGGVLLGSAQHLGIIWLPTGWQDSLVFCVLLVFLLGRPQGFLGRRFPIRVAR